MLFYFQDHDGHGPEFHKHMYRINKETGTNISVGLIALLSRHYFFIMKIFDFYVCCIYSSVLQTRIFHGSKQYEANNMTPYQTAPKGAV